VAAALVLLLGTALFGLHDVALALAGPVVVTWLGTPRSLLSRLTESIGDVSYGVYLFGWPVGLLVASLADSTSPVAVFALSIPIVFALAWAMHRLVEVPVNTIVKPPLFRWLPRFASDAPGLPIIRRAARTIAYVFCLTMIVRFVIFPYPFSANWYGSQWQPLVGVCLVMALILKSAEFLSRRSPADSTTQRPYPP
jgi:peptidoglycan/LPS O-acetylase OafA/YrhL